jgi:hypothetical protein
VHDCSISRKIGATLQIPVILAGGLRPENLIRTIEAVQPYAVDVNSGVEFANGEKDPAETLDLRWHRWILEIGAPALQMPKTCSYVSDRLIVQSLNLRRHDFAHPRARSEIMQLL